MNAEANISERLILSMRAYSSCRGFLSARRVVDVLVRDIRMIDNEYELCVLGKMLRKWNFLVEMHRVETSYQTLSERLPGQLIDISIGGRSRPGNSANTNNSRILITSAS